MSCITDETFSAWVSGELDDRELEQAEGHAADCVDCRAVAIALLGLVPRAGAMLGAVGATIGRYRVVAAVGQGAMGVVLRGHDPVLERDVAIKMVNAIATTAEQRERMLNEAKMLALVDHPNVVRVHDAGIVDDEVFVAMEYVTGTTLVHWLAEAPRPLAARVEVLAGVGAGIAAIHVAGVVHRDIKPDNILVRGTRGVIVDFGLARSVGADGRSGSGVVGTPRFIAPEVRTGGAASVLADQYAWWTVVDDAMQGAAMPARRRRALADAIARGRADDPVRRFPTMHDAVAGLVAACTPPRPRWLIPALAGGIAVAVAAAAVAIPGTAPSGPRLAACGRAGGEVVTRWTGARDRIDRAFAATGAPFAPSSFAAVARVLDGYVPALAARVEAACYPAAVDEPAAVTVARRRCLDQRAREVGATVDVFLAVDRDTVHMAVDRAWSLIEPVCDDVRALVFGPFGEKGAAPAFASRIAAGRALWRAGKLEPALAEAEAILADARAKTDHGAELDALRFIGDIRAAMREPDAAIEVFEQELGLAEAQGRDLEVTMTLALLAEQHGVARHDPVAGHRMISQARAKLVRIGGSNPVVTGYLHRIDAQIYSLEYRCQDAEAEMRAAVADYEHAVGPDHPHVAMALSELAAMSCESTPETLDAATRSVTILARAYGDDHPDVGRALANLGGTLAEAGRAAEARDALVRANAILAAALGADDPALIPGTLGLGDVELVLGNRDAALAAFRRAAPLVDATDGPRSQAAAGVHIGIGKVWLAGSRFADAIAEHALAVEIIAAVIGADHIQMLDPLEGLARAHLALGRPADAVPFAERALALLLEPANHATADELGRDRWLLARALWDSGRDRIAARTLAEQARATLTGEPAREVDAWLATHEVRRTEARR